MKKLIAMMSIMASICNAGLEYTNDLNIGINLYREKKYLEAKNAYTNFLIQHANDAPSNALAYAQRYIGCAYYYLGDKQAAYNETKKLYTDYPPDVIQLISLRSFELIAKFQNKTEVDQVQLIIAQKMQKLAELKTPEILTNVSYFPVQEAGLESTKKFYQTILLNYPVTEKNKTILEQVKGEYLKIKDL